jgi:hypothetical protein
MYTGFMWGALREINHFEVLRHAWADNIGMHIKETV